MMRYRTTIFLFVALLGLAAIVAPPTAAQVGLGEVPSSGDSPRAASSGAHTMIMITGNDMLPADPEVFSRLFDHARDVHEVALKAGYNCSFEPIMAPPGPPPGAAPRPGCVIAYLVLSPRGPEATGDPKQVAAAVLRRLGQFFEKLNRPRQIGLAEQTALAESRAHAMQREVAECRELLSRGRQHLMKLGGGISPDGLEHQCRELRVQRMMLEIELAGLRARRDAILKHLAEGQKRMAERRKEPDMELRKLEAALRVHFNDLERLREANERVPGSVPQKEIEHAMLAAEQVKCDIEARRRAREQEPHDELLAGLNHQLADIDIETATIEAKHRAIDEMLGRLKPEELQQTAARMEEIRGRLDQALEGMAAARREMDELRRQQATLRPPNVTLLDELNTDRPRAKERQEKNKPIEE